MTTPLLVRSRSASPQVGSTTSCYSWFDYHSRRHKDLKLLLNLLAETSGLPESFRILTLFDKKFQTLWKPQVKRNSWWPPRKRENKCYFSSLPTHGYYDINWIPWDKQLKITVSTQQRNLGCFWKSRPDRTTKYF